MPDNILKFPTKVKEPKQRTGSEIKKAIKVNTAITKAHMKARQEMVKRDEGYVDRAVDAIEDMMGSNSDLLRRVGIRLVRTANGMELNGKPKQS